MSDYHVYFVLFYISWRDFLYIYQQSCGLTVHALGGDGVCGIVISTIRLIPLRRDYDVVFSIFF